jgi:opacity protein-like surface antigen
MNVGLLHSSIAGLALDGVGADLQLGYFPHHMFGLLASFSPGGGSAGNGNSFSRQNLALEAQFFPISISRLHLGGFAHGGVAYAFDDTIGDRNGAAFGGGGMLEVSLTSRLALTLRFDYTSAKISPDGRSWQGSEAFTAGIAIY